MPFDSARSLQRETADGPDFARAETAIEQFAARHPYLLFRRGALPGIRRSAAVNPQLQARVTQVLAEIPPAAAQDPRTALKRQARRLINIAFLALTTKGSSADAALAATRSALAEYVAAASWNERPVIRSFLDRGEIAVAVALAYDWLYDRLATRERREIERAILRNVLEPADAAYTDPSLLWPKRRDNCTLVSNSAITIAALAVLHRYPDLSARLVHRSLASAWNVFAGLAPDGAWREGLSYWSLAMRYAGLMVAALESTFGDSFGLADRPGFAQTGDLVLHAVGPFGAAFNFRGFRTSLRRVATHVARLSLWPANRWLAARGAGWLASALYNDLAETGKGLPGDPRSTYRQGVSQRRSRLFSQHLVPRTIGAAGLSGGLGRKYIRSDR